MEQGAYSVSSGDVIGVCGQDLSLLLRLLTWCAPEEYQGIRP